MMGLKAALVHSLIVAILLALAPLARAVMATDGWKAAAKGDADYTMALEAIEREDWICAVAALEKIIERRAWDDDAYTLLGFALRKLGKYQESFEHYDRALELNPYHRGAMEYLGELYLELGAIERAKGMLARLGETCRRASPDLNVESWREQCTEWKDLSQAIDARRTSKQLGKIEAADPLD